MTLVHKHPIVSILIYKHLQITDRKWLDRIIEDEIVKRYSENDILSRTLIGHSGFGVVYKAKLKHTGIPVAMKTLPLSAYADEQELYKKFVKEVCGLLLLLVTLGFIRKYRTVPKISTPNFVYPLSQYYYYR